MKKTVFIIAALLIAIIALFSRRAANTVAPYQRIEGTVFHTIYHITYQSDEDYREEINRLFKEFDGSLSMFNDTSIISRMNRNDTTVVADHYFTTVFEKAKGISEKTDGAFDITVAPLVNLWGFGFKNSDNVSQNIVDSILQFVGYETVSLDADGRLHKQDPRTILDASSIAKGYMCDVVAEFLCENGVENYMVEIGGEIALNGVNPNGKAWGIGINKPTDDSTNLNSELMDVLYLNKGGLATSGNYRNFYYKDGKKYAHTIDPHTGYPIQQDILSSTVIAADCMTADAYATAFMVMGKDRALEILEKDTTLMAYFVVERQKYRKTERQKDRNTEPETWNLNLETLNPETLNPETPNLEILYSPALELRLRNSLGASPK